MTKEAGHSRRIDSILQALERNEDVGKICVIPLLLFAADLFLRWILCLDIRDAGADIAFLGTALYISVLVDTPKSQQVPPVVIIVSFILSWFPWWYCLWWISPFNSLVPEGRDLFGTVIYYSAALLSLIMASAVAAAS